MIQGDFYSIWKINTLTQTFMQESIPEKWQRLGGRALLARILLDEGQHLRYYDPGKSRPPGSYWAGRHFPGCPIYDSGL